ncbi:hypothetical protein V7S43_007303 [Phytophthora oleae]|uniref:Ion transport domain-containing protein n=1 Tax=Phytophthora oleae TaxID=2107226 RepID=A0ABD3FQ26_9STRA
MAEQHPENFSAEGRPSLGGASNENELHDMIVKIRDSPHEQPKRNLQSERVMLRGTYLFHPQEPSIVFWQFFVGIGIVYSIIVVSFRLGYDVDAVGGWYVIEMIIDSFFFLMDILVNCRTASFDEERILIYDPHALFWKYAKNWFLLGLISTVPIDELFQAVVGTSNQTLLLFPTKLLRLFRIARLLKLTRLIKLSRVFGRIRDTVQLSPSTERLFKLLAIMSIFLHTCMFHGVCVVIRCSERPSGPAQENCPSSASIYAVCHWIGGLLRHGVTPARSCYVVVGIGSVQSRFHTHVQYATRVCHRAFVTAQRSGSCSVTGNSSLRRVNYRSR